MSSVFLEFEFDPDDDPENRDVRKRRTMEIYVNCAR